MKESYISIIVPVYNVQNHLKRCLDSLINQTMKEIEIIIVNDGSTDSSREICEEYAQLDSRITLINQENQGVAGARNTGIRAVKTKYLMFVDADDWVTPSFCESAFKVIESQQADVVMFDFYAINQSKMWIQTEFDDTVKVLSKDDAMRYLVDKIGNIVWNKIYSAELFQDISFPTGRCYEDIGTLCFVIEKANKICYLNQALYYYFYRGASCIIQI